MRLIAPHALLPNGWVRDVRITIDAEGMITSVESAVAGDEGQHVPGPLIPGMPNLHSHAFQRAFAGRTGRANPQAIGGDSFWTWRQAMYTFLDRVDADAFEAIAAQAFVEMLEAGYTSVAEFHYVHHDPQGHAYGDCAELAQRVVAAAVDAGIALTLLPVFYAHSGFGGAPPTSGQRRFVHTLDTFAALVAKLGGDAATHGYQLGVAAHSLRAVTEDELAAIVLLAPATGPIHIHAAEQMREVAECVAALKQRPVEWLLDHADIDQRWCLVHATHITPDETERLAASGAVAGIAPTTEADLGDGTFAARAYLDARGRIGIGSDSNTCIDPFAELRQLEWSQRLLSQQRNVLAQDALPVGHSLYAMTLRGGAQALAQPVGAIAAGRRADFVVLDTEDPALIGQDAGDMLDAAIFGPCRRPVRDVMVAGRWVVRDHRHPRREAVLKRYRATLSRLADRQ